MRSTRDTIHLVQATPGHHSVAPLAEAFECSPEANEAEIDTESARPELVPSASLGFRTEPRRVLHGEVGFEDLLFDCPSERVQRLEKSVM